jgi:hypothetical protein
MESEYQEVIEIEPPHDIECLDGDYDAGEEMKMSAVLLHQGSRFIEMLTDDSDHTYHKCVLDDVQ